MKEASQLLAAAKAYRHSKKQRWCQLSDWQVLAIEQALEKMDKSIPGMTHLQQLMRTVKEIKVR